MTERIPDYPPRILEIHVTQGEDIVVIGEAQFAAWELDAVYADLVMREPEETAHCEGCACEETEDQEHGGENV